MTGPTTKTARLPKQDIRGRCRSKRWAILSCQITFDGIVAEPDALLHIIETTEVLEWVGGGTFSYGTADISQCDRVVGAALAGYFGGQSYASLVAAYRQTISAMNSIMYSSTAFGTIFDLMDMNTSHYSD